MPPKHRAQRREAAFQLRKYWRAVEDVCQSTCAQTSDFDSKAVRLLDELNKVGKAEAALDHVKASLQDLTRDKVLNWHTYIYVIMRKFDPEVYSTMREQRWPHAERSRGDSGTSEEKPVDVKLTLNPKATEFVPGMQWVPREDAPPPKKPLPPQTQGHRKGVSVAFGGQPLGWDAAAFGWGARGQGYPEQQVMAEAPMGAWHPMDPPQFGYPAEQPQACYIADYTEPSKEKVTTETAETPVQEVSTDKVEEATVQDNDTDKVGETPLQDDGTEKVAETPVQDDSTEKVAETPVQDDSTEKVAETPVQENGPQSESCAEHAGDKKEEAAGTSIVFECECHTSMGEKVAVVGNSPQLGAWDSSKALGMSTTSETYPVWTSAPVTFVQEEKELEYKFVVVGKGAQLRWEPIEGNRRLELSTSHTPGRVRFGTM